MDILKKSIRIILKDFIKANPISIYDLSRESELTPQKVEFIINNPNSTLDELICVYDAYKRMSDKEKQQTNEKKISQK